MNFLSDQMMEMLNRYNKALGEGGNAGDIISNASFDQTIKMEENSQRDSILNKQSISGEEVSIDSNEYVVKVERRNARLFKIQSLWIFMSIIFVCLAILQFLLFFGKK